MLLNTVSTGALCAVRVSHDQQRSGVADRLLQAFQRQHLGRAPPTVKGCHCKQSESQAATAEGILLVSAAAHVLSTRPLTSGDTYLF